MARKRLGDTGGLVPVPGPSPPLPALRIDLGTVVSDWMGHLKESTRRVYARALLEFAQFLKVRTPQEAAAALCSMRQGEANATALAFRNALADRGLQVSSVNVKLSAVLSLNDICRVAGFVPWRIEVSLGAVEPYRDTRGPGAAAVEPVLARLEAEPGEGPARDCAILNVIYRRGLRRGEVASLDLEHVDLETPAIWLMGKGRRERESATLSPKAAEAVRRWIDFRGPDPGPLFTALDRGHRGARLTGMSIWRIVKGHGLGWPHAVRHTSVSEVLIRSGGNILAAQQYARHRDPKVTMKYWDRIRDVAGDAARLMDGPTEGTR